MDDDRSLQGRRDVRRKNRRTAAWLAGLALFFFVMLFAKRLWLG